MALLALGPWWMGPGVAEELLGPLAPLLAPKGKERLRAPGHMLQQLALCFASFTGFRKDKFQGGGVRLGHPGTDPSLTSSSALRISRPAGPPAHLPSDVWPPG